MKPINIIRCQNLLDAISPRALKAWADLWKKPTENITNLRSAAELMNDEELSDHFETWYRVMLEDQEDRRLQEKNPRYEARSKPQEVKNHVIELYVIIREVLTRYHAGRLHVDAGLLARSGGPPKVKRSVGHQNSGAES